MGTMLTWTETPTTYLGWAVEEAESHFRHELYSPWWVQVVCGTDYITLLSPRPRGRVVAWTDLRAGGRAGEALPSGVRRRVWSAAVLALR